jgi:hypothetical protein
MPLSKCQVYQSPFTDAPWQMPSLPISLHRCPLANAKFTNLSSQMPLGKCQVYQSLFTDAPWQMPSLPIPLYRTLPVSRWQKNNNKIIFNLAVFFIFKNKCDNNLLHKHERQTLLKLIIFP